MDHYIVYDAATGGVFFRAAVGSGLAAAQVLEPGQRMLVVPYSAFKSDGLDEGVVRDALLTRVDVEAEALRLKFITAGVGQALTYQYKAQEAAAWSLDNSAATPFLSAEATALGRTLESLCEEVLERVRVWSAVGSAIEGARMAAKVAIIDPTGSLADALKGGTVDWLAVIGGPVMVEPVAPAAQPHGYDTPVTVTPEPPTETAE